MSPAIFDVLNFLILECIFVNRRSLWVFEKLILITLLSKKLSDAFLLAFLRNFFLKILCTYQHELQTFLNFSGINYKSVHPLKLRNSKVYIKNSEAVIEENSCPFDQKTPALGSFSLEKRLSALKHILKHQKSNPLVK